MEIREMNFEDVETRIASIREELNGENPNLDALTEEVTALEERKAELKAEAEKRTAIADVVNAGDCTVVEEVETITIEEERKNMFGVETKEYREAFFKNLVGLANAEQRGMFADNSAYGDGIALPVTTDKAIWDQTLSKHPILADVDIIKSGIVMKVSQVTPSNLNTEGGVKKKLDSANVVQLTFTTNEVVLAGADFCTYVTLSYAEAKMSVGAMEQFLVNEISNALGELLAKDVFATILTNASANEVSMTSGTDSYFTKIKEALATATMAENPVIYAPASAYYAILGEVDSNGQPIVREGVVLGAPLKKDNAATKITVVDPSLFVLNVVADTKITSQEVVSKGGYDIGGYLRAQGCLRKTNAGAFITVS